MTMTYLSRTKAVEVVKILERGSATSLQISKALGVTPRTIYRYVDQLRDNGFDIIGEAGTGYSLGLRHARAAREILADLER